MRRVNYIAPADHTGYARAAAQYMTMLVEHGVEVHFQPLLPGLNEGEQTLGFWYECARAEQVDGPLRAMAERPFMPDADVIIHAVPEYYSGLARWLDQRKHTGRRLGMTVWETDRIPAHWPALLNTMGGLIVPSEWNAQVFAACGVVVPIACVPHASEFEGRPPGEEAIQALRRRLPDLTSRFVFYSIGAWNPRKGNDLLLRAFAIAFQGRSNVVLILKTTPEALTGWRGWWRRQQKNVIFVTEDLLPVHMASLHAVGNCYVSCSRGEGWGLGIFEAACFGKPIIVPELGGHRAFLPEGARLKGLVRSRMVKIGRTHRDSSYTKHQRWVEVDLHDAAETMRWAVHHAEAARLEASEVSRFVRHRFGAEGIARKLMEVLGDSSERTLEPIEES